MSIPTSHYGHMSNLRSAREAAGISREKLAQLSETSTSTIARIELQGHVPNGATMVRLAAALGVTVDSLLAERVA